jgi:hypothetical protein
MKKEENWGKQRILSYQLPRKFSITDTSLMMRNYQAIGQSLGYDMYLGVSVRDYPFLRQQKQRL